jgi:hypothetical protein
MKRMNEVFELPVDEMDICEAVDHYSEEKDAAIVRAVNHVDALADALESLTSDYTSYKAINDIDLTDDHSFALEVKMNAAKAALAAYRGEK